MVEASISEEVFIKGCAAIGAGLAVGLASLGAGAGESGIGAAGAAAEDRGFLGLGLLFTVIPETIVVFGFVISFILMFAFGQTLIF